MWMVPEEKRGRGNERPFHLNGRRERRAGGAERCHRVSQGRHLWTGWNVLGCDERVTAEMHLSWSDLDYLERVLSLYRDSPNGLQVVGRIFFLLLLNCSVWTCKGPA